MATAAQNALLLDLGRVIVQEQSERAKYDELVRLEFLKRTDLPAGGVSYELTNQGRNLLKISLMAQRDAGGRRRQRRGIDGSRSAGRPAFVRAARSLSRCCFRTSRWA